MKLLTNFVQGSWEGPLAEILGSSSRTFRFLVGLGSWAVCERFLSWAVPERSWAVPKHGSWRFLTCSWAVHEQVLSGSWAVPTRLARLEAPPGDANHSQEVSGINLCIVIDTACGSTGEANQLQGVSGLKICIVVYTVRGSTS